MRHGPHGETAEQQGETDMIVCANRFAEFAPSTQLPHSNAWVCASRAAPDTYVIDISVQIACDVEIVA